VDAQRRRRHEPAIEIRFGDDSLFGEQAYIISQMFLLELFE
jgi:hypothetical protein